MKGEKIRLNPFVYISETDVRFYLLVLIGIFMPLSWASLFLYEILFFVTGIDPTKLSNLLSIVLTFSFVLILICWKYKGYPKKIIKKSELDEFDKNKFPKHWECIEKLYGKYLSTDKQPTLMYQLKGSDFAFTFGTKNHMYIAIFGRMIKKFREKRDAFKSIFLHEMAHIVNKDVDKTYLAASTWSSLLLILSIPLVIFLLSLLILSILIGLSGFSEIFFRFNAHYRLGGLILYFLLFLAIVYVLRNQILQLREFYADAKVLEWEESPDELIKTLEGIGEEPYLKFEILSKFHPKINERIQVLKDNLCLFVPDLWVAFTIGFSYGLIEQAIGSIITIISSVEWVPAGSWDIGTRAFTSLLIVPILMFAISSSFHKSILKDILNDNIRYISTSTILNTIKFSMVFSIGYVTILIIALIPLLYGYTLIGTFFKTPIAWIFYTIFIFIPLIFLIIFASMLIRRSFSKKEAEKNFLIITLLSSFLYIINYIVAIYMLKNLHLLIVFFLIFSVITYTFIKIKDRKLCCPNCNNKISNLSGHKLNCPNCHHDLYSWAVYSFSKNSVS